MVEVIHFKTTDKVNTEKAFHIRNEVFVVEQNVAHKIEFDEFEDDSIHYMILKDGMAVGTARWRFTEHGIKLERFAVLDNYRNMGLGYDLLKQVMADVIFYKKPIYLHSQIQAVRFYSRMGFKKSGRQFVEAGIKHFLMKYTC